MHNYIEFENLLGKTLTEIKVYNVHGDRDWDGDSIHFFDDSGNEYVLNHEQECCESVIIEDICGDLEWLIGSPITMAQEKSNHESKDWEGLEDGYCISYTFYELATINGSVTIRWYGSSNGYYSTNVSFNKVEDV